jgi:hypothetical protein
MSSKALLRKTLVAAALAASMSAFASNYYVVVPVPARTDTGAANISVSLSAYTPPAGFVGDAYPGFDFNQALQVTGDQNFNPSNVRWYVSAGALPAGLTLNATGKLTGTPTAAGTSSFVVTAVYRTKSGTNTFQVSVMNLQVSLGSAALPNATQGATYSYDMKTRLSVTGDSSYSGAGVSWSIASGNLPAGLSLGADGLITGVATAEGTYPFTVRAAYRTKSGIQGYQVVVGAITVGLQTASLPDAKQGTAYSYDLKTLLTVSGDAAYSSSGVSWSVTSGALPAGLSIGADGVITGSATAEGTFPFTVKAAYKTKSGMQGYQVVVGAITVALAAATPPGGIVGIAYNNGSGFDLKPSVNVNGDGAYAGTGAGVTWSVTGGALPAGMNLSTAGVIGGTPTTTAVSSTVQVQASYKGKTATQSYSLPITGSIKQLSGYRAYADGTYASTCNAYRNPSAPHYYQGATGDGIYRITPGGASYDVYCDMTTNGGGYTVIEALHDTRYYAGASFNEAPAGSPPVPGEANGSYLTASVAIALANLSSEVRISEYGTSNAAWTTSATMLNNLRQGLLANYNTQTTYDPTSLWSVSSAGLAQFNSTQSIAGQGADNYPTIFWSGGNSSGLHVTGGGGLANASWHYNIQNGPMVVSYR